VEFFKAKFYISILKSTFGTSFVHKNEKVNVVIWLRRWENFAI